MTCDCVHSFGHSFVSSKIFWHIALSLRTVVVPSHPFVSSSDGMLSIPGDSSAFRLHTPLQSAGSPSHVGNVAVYDINQLSLPTPFNLFLCPFLSLWFFQLYCIHQFSRKIPAFSLCFSGLISALIIGSFNYFSLYESLPQPWYNPLWLTGLKASTD